MFSKANFVDLIYVNQFKSKKIEVKRVFEALQLLKKNFLSSRFYQFRLDHVKNESLDRDDLREERSIGKDELDSGCRSCNRRYAGHDI